MRTMSKAVHVLALLLAASVARAETVTVVTSFPNDLTEIYKKAFEQHYPDTTVEFIGKSTSAAISHIRGSKKGERPDVLWASAPDAFETMAREKLLEKAPEVINAAVPPRIGKYPMNDPEGMYYGQALSGYGIMWNKQYLQTHKLTTPAQWHDLTKPEYFGHVAMSSPSRSGTTHLTIETILQGEGWDRGWSQLLQIAGNCAEITERSTGVPDGVKKGQYGIGLVIDFFALSAKYTGAPVEFAYPAVTAVVPASIALVAGAKNSAAGKKFIAFALSRAGQELLLEPRISRIPVMHRGDFFDSVPGTYPNIFGVAVRAKVRFDSNLAQSRFALVSLLFDQSITLLMPDLQAATKAIQDAEKNPDLSKYTQAAALLQRARELAYAPLVSEKALLALSPSAPPGTAAPASHIDIAHPALQQLQGQARQRYRQARTLALDAQALIRH